MTGIYLDHNATTPLRPEARAAMARAMDVAWGNPSSTHAIGRVAREVVESARREVAALMGALPEEIIFTSGGTEGDNLAVRGLARAARDRRAGRGAAHVVSSPLEHPAVQAALDELAADGFAVTRLPVGPKGEVTAEALRAAMRDDTVLVSLQTANHEIGNLNDIRSLAAVAHERGALFHTDAVQAAGRVPLDVRDSGVDAATISAHKMYGPKGTGALFLRRGVDLDRLVVGGHQERAQRGGTENVAGIAGFGAAAALARAEMDATGIRIAGLRDRLERQLLAVPGSRLHGVPDRRVPGTTSVAFDGAEGQLVMVGLDLDGVCVSTGAACTSGTLEPSPVLLALGLSPPLARQGVRFSLGRETTEDDVDRAARITAAVVARVRAAAASAGGFPLLAAG